MGLMTNYLQTTKNLDSFLDSILSAQAPEKFTNKFLQQLGFSSTNDRLLIGLLKGLGLLSDNGEPTERYYRFLDGAESKKVMAQAIREAYEDLFALNTNANQMSVEEVKGKFKMLTQGQKSENVVSNMAVTFNALCEWADWSESQEDTAIETESQNAEFFHSDLFSRDTKISPSLHYNIQVHLPETRDVAVYDAIFSSLKKHLL